MRTSSRVILSALLLVVLSTGAVHATPWSLIKPGAPALLSSLWDGLVGQLAGIWEKARGGFDPNGLTISEPEPVPGPTGEEETEGRGGFDPNG